MWAHDKEVPQRIDDDHGITRRDDVGTRQRDEMANKFSAAGRQEEWHVKGGLFPCFPSPHRSPKPSPRRCIATRRLVLHVRSCLSTPIDIVRRKYLKIIMCCTNSIYIYSIITF